MTVPNNVEETSTTTGTAAMVLLGAVSDAITWSAGLGASRRSNYSIIHQTTSEYENGTGYIDGSGDLVREFVTDSSNSNNIVTLTTGTKNVLISPLIPGQVAPAYGISDLGFATAKILMPANVVGTSTVAIVANRIYYIPFVVIRPVAVDTIGIAITTGAGSAPPTNKIHLALYDVDPNTGDPGFKLFEKTDLAPNATGQITGTFTEFTLQPGLYFSAFWCDTTPTVRAQTTVAPQVSTNAGDTTALTITTFHFRPDQSSLSSLPTTGDANDASSGSFPPIVFLGHS